MSGRGKDSLGSRNTLSWTPLGHLLFFVGLSLTAYRIYTAGSLLLTNHGPAASVLGPEPFQDRCNKFLPKISPATLELVEYLPAHGQANLRYRDPTCGGPGSSNAVKDEVCRVALYVPTSSRSGVHFEAWLPKEWNGRFLSTGNGGIAGCHDYAGLVYTIDHGFAAVATNNGHNGTGGELFFHNEDVIHDFADRALHTGVDVGKKIVEQFYSKKHKKSYFLGCSQGGRQGIANALKHPDDFDGIVAGAPALDFNNLVSWRASFYPLTGALESTGFIDADKWSNLIHHEVLKQCDHIDGVLDGIIEYPNLCDFRPESLLCEAGEVEGNSCLSQEQADIVRKVFEPLKHPDGSVIYPGMQVGSEQRAIDRLYAGKPFTDSRDWFRYVVRGDPTWDPATFTTEDARIANDLNPFNIRTYPSARELQPFRGRGGKILTYHGMQDQQITGHVTRQWMDYMRTYSSDMELQDWIRYFRISGMLHCAGGPGAWMIGQTGGDVAYDPQRNVLAAIVAWVEEGVAPNVLEGTKLVDESQFGQTTVSFTRKHCRYPQRNRYIGLKSQQDSQHDKTASLPVSSTAEQWLCE